MTSNQQAAMWVPSSPPVSSTKLQELTKDRFHRLPEFSHWKGESLGHQAVRSSQRISPHPSPSVRKYPPPPVQTGGLEYQHSKAAAIQKWHKILNMCFSNVNFFHFHHSPEGEL